MASKKHRRAESREEKKRKRGKEREANAVLIGYGAAPPATAAHLDVMSSLEVFHATSRPRRLSRHAPSKRVLSGIHERLMNAASSAIRRQKKKATNRRKKQSGAAGQGIERGLHEVHRVLLFLLHHLGAAASATPKHPWKYSPCVARHK